MSAFSQAALSDFIGLDDGLPLPISISAASSLPESCGPCRFAAGRYRKLACSRGAAFQRGARIGTLGGHYRFSFVVFATGHRMRIVEHPESHIVKLDDGSTWQIFPGDIDRTLAWLPTTELRLFEISDEVASHALINSDDGT